MITPDTVQFNRSWALPATAPGCGARCRPCPSTTWTRPPPTRCARAADAYRGEFLEGHALADCPALEEWLTWQREYYRRRAGEALQQLAERALADGDYGQAERDARRLLQLDPWNEGAHRQVMSALALGGQRGAALAQYEACVRALAEGPGVEPEPETTAL